jgi:cation transport regulator ChaB
MPFSGNNELPKGVKGLPSSAQTMWRKVFNSAYEGTCKGRKDRDACASRIAWSQVSKHYDKGEGGKYHAKADLAEFSMAIADVTHNKQAGTFRWKAVASDIREDSFKDNMTLELYSDFLHRIETGEQVPEPFRSEFWSGGVPYLSVSHYPDLDGKAVPGPTKRVFIDGDCFKSDGEFDKTPLGIKCYDAIRKDLYEEPKPENPIRISIAFLDWAHRHKSEGNFLFERESVDDICPQCVIEKLLGKYEGVEYLKGQIVHLALTRWPVNKRTNVEVERAMTTRKEDAASIIGDELADELDEKATLVGKSETVETSPLVIKANEDEETPEEETPTEETPEMGTPAWVADLDARLAKIEAGLNKPEVELSVTESHPLDAAFEAFKAQFDAVSQQSIPEADKLQQLQEPMNAIGNTIRSLIVARSEPEPEPELEGENVDLVKALSRAMSESLRPFSDKLDLVLDRVAQQTSTEVPVRRSITPTLDMQADLHGASSQTPGKPLGLKAFARRSVGLSQ